MLGMSKAATNAIRVIVRFITRIIILKVKTKVGFSPANVKEIERRNNSMVAFFYPSPSLGLLVKIAVALREVGAFHSLDPYTLQIVDS
jgi:hypothetical protein